MSSFNEPIYATRIERIEAIQAHPVPDKVTMAYGPFSSELLAEPEIVHDYLSAHQNEYLPGSTAQNNYKPPKYLRCSLCSARVLEEDTPYHICEE